MFSKTLCFVFLTAENCYVLKIKSSSLRKAQAIETSNKLNQSSDNTCPEVPFLPWTPSFL